MDLITTGILVVIAIIALFFILRFAGGCLIRLILMLFVIGVIVYLIYIFFFRAA